MVIKLELSSWGISSALQWNDIEWKGIIRGPAVIQRHYSLKWDSKKKEHFL